MTAAPIATLLAKAAAHLEAFRPDEAASLARSAVEIDRTSLAGWRLLALACEAGGDLAGALSAYEAALALAPGDPDLLTRLGRIALELDLAGAAEGLLRQALAARQGDTSATCLLARALAAQARSDEAVDVLMAHLADHPDAPVAWDALGVLAGDRGDLVAARTCFTEALRLAPDFTAARFNAANLLITEGDSRSGLEALEGIPEVGLSPRERATLVFSRACARLRLGDLEGGWKDYAIRNDPGYPGSAEFDIPGKRWRPGAPLSERKLLIVGEQGLGDEVIFGGLLPDLLSGKDRPAALALAVEPRLTGLFQRSFPGVTVSAHTTQSVGGRRVRRLGEGWDAVDYSAWTPMADLLPVLRPDLESFRGGGDFLAADPDRIGDWRARLAGLGPELRVGLLWKSAMMSGSRGNAFAAFDAWRPVLEVPGVTFVNLQYGDCKDEVAFAWDQLGVKIRTPAGLDLKQDLEGVAAMSCALDLVVGVSNASFNLAAACGVPAWLITAPDAWTTLGSDVYPWYPQVRLFASRRAGDWDEVFRSVAEALAASSAG